MTNSDAFAHLHRVRASKLLKELETARLQLDAAIADLEPMARAERLDELAPGSGLAGGGRSTDVADPTANAALRFDSTVEKWGAYHGGLAQTITGLRDVTWARQATLADPTPTGLCRHGDCPDRKPATTNIGGVPRCSACKAFWYSISNPDERFEREEPRQPRGVPRSRQVA